jgi:hypothetical protein
MSWHGPVVSGMSAASIVGMDTLSTHHARLLGLDDFRRPEVRSKYFRFRLLLLGMRPVLQHGGSGR